MTPLEMYQILRQANATTACEAFDGHVLACILAAAIGESQAGGSFTDAIGICGAALRSHIERYFPGCLEPLESLGLDREPAVGEDELCLRELLWRFRSAPIQGWTSWSVTKPLSPICQPAYPLFWARPAHSAISSVIPDHRGFPCMELKSAITS